MSGFSLIETMRHEPGRGILRASLHRARFFNSARKLGFSGHEAAWEAAASYGAPDGETTRLRIELLPSGEFQLAATPFVLQAADAVWSVAIAGQARLRSGEPILRHKTSMRGIYDAARAEFTRDQCDEVLLLNEKGELCEGTITSLFVEVAPDLLLTPPLSSGCLAGVLRSSLLCARRARVAPIQPRHLEEHPFFIGNSLRGLIRGKLR